MQQEISISTDVNRLDMAYVHQSLSNTYWAKDRTMEEMKVLVESSSLNFGMYDGKRQIGYARVLSDRYRFAYIMDVFIDDACQGKGLGQMLMKAILEHEYLINVPKVVLGTRDAHGLYAKFGFKPLAHPEIWMELVKEKLVC